MSVLRSGIGDDEGKTVTPDLADAALTAVLGAGRDRAAATSPDQVRLWEALADAASGGKRIRPRLVLAAHRALGGRDESAAAAVGAAVELLHTAFVIHDDVIDGDDVRRGRLNVSGTYRALALADGAGPAAAEELGRTAGILAGDLALTAAVRAVATCGAPGEVVANLLDLFDVALHATAAGELLDVHLATLPRSLGLESSLDMAQRKTGAYSFVLPLQAGAVIAGSDSATLTRLELAGRRLGLAFQLYDDLIGVFGDPALTGKSATGDLRTRKQTALIAHARTTDTWPRLEVLLGRELTDEELDEARRLLTECGSRRYVEDLASTESVAACDELVAVGLPADVVADIAAPPAALLGCGVAA